MTSQFATKMNADELYKLQEEKGAMCVRIPNYTPVIDWMKKNDLDYKKICGNCNKLEKSNKDSKLLKCGGCKIQYYCSKECQVKDWKEHKKICKRMNNANKNPTERDIWTTKMKAVILHSKDAENNSKIKIQKTIWEFIDIDPVNFHNCENRNNVLYARLITWDEFLENLDEKDIKFHREKFNNGYTIFCWKGFVGMLKHKN